MSKYINLWRNNRNMIDSPTQALCRLIYHGSRELLEYKIESDKLQKEYEDLKTSADVLFHVRFKKSKAYKNYLNINEQIAVEQIA